MSSSSPQSTIVNSPSISQNLTTLTLVGYAFAISFAFLLFISAILLASYICCFRRRHHNNTTASTTSSSSSPDTSIVVPRFVFVADNDDEDDVDRAAVGLDHAVINSYPKFPFSKFTTRSKSNFDSESSSCCAICLCEYREAEMLRMMPDCKHLFHLQCLDAWLRLNGSCPVCRNSPLPTPISTPLAEVVPLAQYSADRSRTMTTRSSSD